MTNLLAFFVAVVAALLMLTFSGCATVSVSTVTPEGKQCTASAYALFLDINAASISACGAKTTQLQGAVNTELGMKLIETGAALLKAGTAP